MLSNADLRLRQANERIARGHRRAARARLAEQARRRHRPSLRSRAGLAMISLGHRLASEPAQRSGKVDRRVIRHA